MVGANLKAVIFDFDGTLFTCPYDFAAMRAAVLEIALRFGVSKETIAGLGGGNRILAAGCRGISGGLGGFLYFEGRRIKAEIG